MNTIQKKLNAGAISLAALFLPMSPIYGVELGVFGDVSLVASSDENESDSFVLGGLDLYGAQQISDKTMAFIEVVFENDGDSFVVDVERLWIRQNFSDAFRLGAGRFHAPLGYWNRNYHHGVLMQDTPSRPGFLDFEDGTSATLPMHIVGLMATGDLGGNFSYELSISNSSSIDTMNAVGDREILIGNVADGSDDKSLFGRITYGFEKLPMSLGLFGMRNNLLDNDGGIVNSGKDITTTNLFGLDLRYDNSTFDVLAEYYYFDNQDETGGVAGEDGTADAFYVQLGYRFTDKWKIIYRYEDLAIDDNDGYFNVLGSDSYTGNVAALRYDVNEVSALTLEFNDKSYDQSEDVTTYTLNWSFMMF